MKIEVGFEHFAKIEFTARQWDGNNHYIFVRSGIVPLLLDRD